MTAPPISSEGSSFTQKGMKGGEKKGKKDSDDKKMDDNKKGEKPKDPYKEMECFNCGKKGHPARFCPKKKDDKDDSSSISSKSSSKKSLEKQFKSIKKSFTQLQAAIEESDSDSSDEHSHFQSTSPYAYRVTVGKWSLGMLQR